MHAKAEPISLKYQNEINLDASGNIRRADAYGADYLSEFRRVITGFAAPGPRTLLEWGMGNSTKFFIEERAALGLDALYSIDHSADYFASLHRNLPPWSKFHPFCLDLVGPRTSDRDPEMNYATFPLSIDARFDIIFIDGRRRMECAFTAAQLCRADTIVILHDYRRRRYQGARFLFDIIDDGTQFRVMKLKPLFLTWRPDD